MAIVHHLYNSLIQLANNYTGIRIGVEGALIFGNSCPRILDVGGQHGSKIPPALTVVPDLS